MKKRTVQIFSSLLTLTLLIGSGAQAVPAEPATINQSMLLEQSSQKQPTYTYPDRFIGNWTTQEGRLTIHADAQVTAPQGVILPTATVEPRKFNEADVDNLLRVFLKSEPLYDFTLTRQELQNHLDYINSPEWKPDPEKGTNSPEELEQQRKKLNEWYQNEIAKAPEQKIIIHNFTDSSDPDCIDGRATVDGVEYNVHISNHEDLIYAQIDREDYKYSDVTTGEWGEISRDDAITQADTLIKSLGFEHMVLDDVQKQEEDGTWRLYYVPTVNEIRLPSIREHKVCKTDGGYETEQYWFYNYFEEKNPDTVSWFMENIQLCVGKEGVLSFQWYAPATEPVVTQTQSSLLPFEEIAAIADTMLPVVVVGPEEKPLIEIDQRNGEKTYMDVEITEVSLNLMRIRDKGSLHGTIVPVWDFWGTWEWYGFEGTYGQKGTQYTTQPMLTLNAIDGSVVSRKFGY